MRRLVVERASDRSALWAVETADSWLARLRGLIGRAGLNPGEGLFFPGTNGIHMLFMRFAIDCVFVSAEADDGTREVVAVRNDLRPWTGVVWFVRHARGALEVSAGEAGERSIKKGDRLRLIAR